MNDNLDHNIVSIILNQTLLPVCIIEADHIVQANEAFLAKFKRATLPMALKEVLQAPEEERLIALQQQVLQGDGLQTPIIRLSFTLPTQYHWHVIGTIRPLDDPASGILITWQDDQRHDTLLTLQSHLQGIDEFIMMADFTNQRILYANHPTFLHYDWQAIIESDWLLNHIHPADQMRVRVLRDQTDYKFSSQNTIEYRLLASTPLLPASPQADGATPIVQNDPDAYDPHATPDANQDSPRYEWVESRETCLESDADGNALQMLFHMSIVTQRKESEQMLYQRNRALITIQELAKTINQTLDVQTTMQALFTKMKDLIPFVSASIFLTAEPDTAVLFAHANLPDDALVTLKDHIIVDNLTKHVIERGKPHIVADTYLEPEWYMMESSNYIRSWMGVPLLREGKGIGVMNFDHDQVGFYDETHYQDAVAIASHVSLALHNNRLYERLQDELQEREQTEEVLLEALASIEAMYQCSYLMMQSNDLAFILPDILSLISLAIDADTIFLVSFNLMTGEPQFMQSQPELPAETLWRDFAYIVGMPEADTPKMPDSDLNFTGGQTINLDDGRFCIASVLHRRGTLVAIRAKNAFEAHDLDLVVTLAGTLSITIERDELTTQLQDHVNRLEMMVASATSSLQLERQRLQAILDATGEGIIYMENSRIQYANPAFCQMLGYDAGELQGMALNDLRFGARNALPSIFDTDETQPVNRSNTALTRKDRSILYASLTFSLLGGADNAQMTRVVAVVRDNSHEKALHEQRMRFISNAAHELRTPLTSLHLRLHMARRQPERIDDHLNSLDHVYQYLKLLVEELLDLSRFESGTIKLDYQGVDLCKLAEEAIDWAQDHAAQANIHLEHDFKCPVQAEVDPDRITQVLHILLTNGINYSEAHDTVTLALKVITHQEAQFVRITVSDTGMGIAPNLLPDQIFVPFARARLGTRRETGMGLAIVREIIKLHGAQIEALPNGNKGSIFRIILPLSPASNEKSSYVMPAPSNDET